MKGGVEIREISGHRDEGIEPSADLVHFVRAVMNSLRMRGSERERRIPGAAARVIETSASGVRMAKRCRHDRGHRPSGDPFVVWHGMQDAQLVADSVVGPSLEFENRFEVLGRSNSAEDSYRRIAAGDKAAGRTPCDMGERRLQFHAPRRPSSRRGTR